jgi:hypothetical protein
VNPGLHHFVKGYNFDDVLRSIEALHERCRRLFPPPPRPTRTPPPGAGSRECILHTTAFTAHSRAGAERQGHRQHYGTIKGYNAATMGLWAADGLPIVDAGALSAAPAIMNNIGPDRVHFSSEPFSFYQLSWQAILNTVAANNTRICERGALSAGGGRR